MTPPDAKEARLREAEERLRSLQAQLGEAQDAVRVAAEGAKAGLGQWYTRRKAAGEEEQSISQPLDALLGKLEPIRSSETLVEALLSLQELSSTLDSLMRQLEDTEAEVGDLTPAFTELAAQAVDLCTSMTQRSRDIGAILESSGNNIFPLPLTALAEASSAKLQGSLMRLRGCLAGAFERALETAGWPPSLDSEPGCLESCNEAALKTMRELVAYLTEIQTAAEPRDEERAGLWAVGVLAKPLAERLEFHFTDGRDTDRIDKPEWMFSHALKMARHLSPEIGALEPGLQACSLPQACSLQVEFCNAIREAVTGLLSTHYLPGIVNGDEPALMLHLVDECCRFESSLFPLRGGLEEDDDLLLGPPLWAHGSCLSAVAGDSKYLGALERVELREAQRQLEEAVEGDRAWAVPTTEWDQGEVAWRREFYPSSASQRAVDVLRGLLHRASCLPTPEATDIFCRNVMTPAAGALLGSMTRIGQRAENSKDLASEAWAPRVGALCSAAHFIEHSLRETSNTCLGLGFGAARATVDQVATSFAAFSYKWAVKLAAAVTQRFEMSARQYKSSSSQFMKGEAEDAGVDPDISRTWAPVLQQLHEVLERLGRALDAVNFRKMWRAVAAGINQFLYNEIVTEAQFTAAGAKQFDVDCKALVMIFRAYTPRPNAHFKELREACTLLLLDEDGLAEVEEALESPESAEVQLRQLGINHLNIDQAECVLDQRLSDTA